MTVGARVGRRGARAAGRWIGGLALLLAAVVSGCSDDPIGFQPELLEGIWNAQRLVAINAADTSESEDLIALGGGMVVSIEPGDRISISFNVVGITDTETGTYTLDGNAIEMILDGDPVSGTYILDGNTLSMRIDEGVEWDFGNDGIDVPAILDMEFVRIG